MFKRKLLSAIAVMASLFSGQAKTLTTVADATQKTETSAAILSKELKKVEVDVAKKVGGNFFVSTNGGVYPMKRKNQKQYRKHCRQNPTIKRSKKHRSKN